jgi:lipopolysaccharide transport system permease protein
MLPPGRLADPGSPVAILDNVAERTDGAMTPPEVRPHTVPLSERTTIHIRPSTRWVPLDLKAVWEYRELLLFLTWRDVKVRYKQTAFGAAWALIQPFMMMVVFTIFLGHLAGLSSEGKPYPLFVFAALVPWTFFAQSLASTANSLVGGGNLVSKVYFPRVVLPIASAGAFLVDLLLALGLLGAMMIWYGVAPGWGIVLLPVFILLALMTALAVGLWLAALNVRYRDVRYALPFLVQLWLFATPVAYAASLVPDRWRFLYALNPMAGVVEGFRWALVGTDSRPGAMLIVSAAATLVTLVTGLAYFRKVERTFADLI